MTTQADPSAGATMGGVRPSRQPGSLQGRLLAWMSAGFALLATLLLGLLWSYALTAANRTQDLLLTGSALALIDRVAMVGGDVVADVPHSALAILGLAPEDRVTYGVALLEDGTIRPVTGARDLPLPPDWDPSGPPRFYEAEMEGEAARFAVHTRILVGELGPVRALVRVGQTTRARDAQALDLFALGAAGLALVSLVGLGAVWLAIRRSLRPLAAIGRELARRHHDDLSPIAADPPREVRELTRSLDEFMHRLDTARRATERFIADVAHQTRTSLAALRSRQMRAAESADERDRLYHLARAEEQADALIRLSNQLLSHAMVIHRAGAESNEPADLAEIARTLLGEMLRDSGMRELDLSLDASKSAKVIGDPVSLREALRNLVDNAARHGRGGGGQVRVRVVREAGSVLLSVEDDGPGIPQSRRAEALRRFNSLVPERGGSGLGLSIVAAVARAHGAALDLGRSELGGLLVRLRFATLALFAGLLATASPAGAEDVLIWSATDTSAFAPVIARFEARHGLTVDYVEYETATLHTAVIDADATSGATVPDLVISSAMDLQVDLVNRRLARPVEGLPVTALPGWASWRGELFGFSFEPAAMIYDPGRMPPESLPRTRADLAGRLRDDPSLGGRVGTYDLARSGVGYLFATQDAVLGPQSRLLDDAMRTAGAETFCCTSAMIDAVADGRLVFATNVIGPYALERTRVMPGVAVHFFEDYNLVMARTAFVPRGAARGDAGERFLAFLLSEAGQSAILESSALLPIDEGVRASIDLGPAFEGAAGSFYPIRLGPALLTYLNAEKRDAFLAERNATSDD